MELKINLEGKLEYHLARYCKTYFDLLGSKEFVDVEMLFDEIMVYFDEYFATICNFFEFEMHYDKEKKIIALVDIDDRTLILEVEYKNAQKIIDKYFSPNRDEWGFQKIIDYMNYLGI